MITQKKNTPVTQNHDTPPTVHKSPILPKKQDPVLPLSSGSTALTASTTTTTIKLGKRKPTSVSSETTPTTTTTHKAPCLSTQLSSQRSASSLQETPVTTCLHLLAQQVMPFIPQGTEVLRLLQQPATSKAGEKKTILDIFALETLAQIAGCTCLNQDPQHRPISNIVLNRHARKTVKSIQKRPVLAVKVQQNIQHFWQELWSICKQPQTHDLTRLHPCIHSVLSELLVVFNKTFLKQEITVSHFQDIAQFDAINTILKEKMVRSDTLIKNTLYDLLSTLLQKHFNDTLEMVLKGKEK